MTVLNLLALVFGYVWLSMAAVFVLLGVGLMLGDAYLTVEERVQARWAHWRRFSQRYDRLHKPQRVEPSNVVVLPYPTSTREWL